MNEKRLTLKPNTSQALGSEENSEKRERPARGDSKWNSSLTRHREKRNRLVQTEAGEQWQKSMTGKLE
jgi:hypothetical protein